MKILKILLNLPSCFFKSCYSIFFLRQFKPWGHSHMLICMAGLDTGSGIFLTLRRTFFFFLFKLIMKVSNSETLREFKINGKLEEKISKLVKKWEDWLDCLCWTFLSFFLYFLNGNNLMFSHQVDTAQLFLQRWWGLMPEGKYLKCAVKKWQVNWWKQHITSLCCQSAQHAYPGMF